VQFSLKIMLFSYLALQTDICYNHAMTLQERKDKADIISKEADVVYKKSFLLLASTGGVGSYAIMQDGLFSYILFGLFGFLVLGIVINYFELNNLKKEIKGCKNG
jgi:hypothetical protein